MKTVGIPNVDLTARKRTRTWLVEIQAGVGSSTFYRFTNYSSNVVIPSNMLVSYITGDPVVNITFSRQWFSVGGITTSSDDQQGVDVVFLDINQAVKSILLGSDMRNWPVSVYEVFLSDVGNVLLGLEPHVVGTADGFQSDEQGQNARSTLAVTSSRLPEQSTGPRQEYRPSCRFRYKDAQCGATSILTTCNRSLADCIVRNNQERFGGFPYAPKPGAKFKWGPFDQIVNARPIWSPAE